MRATLTLIIRGARSKNNSVCSTFGKIRIVLGICFNIWLLYCYGKDLLNGGMYDSDWDYYYHLTPQYFIIVSCCVSLFSDCMLFKKKDKTFLYILVVSNLVFRYSFFTLFSVDTKTMISYFWPVGFIAFIIMGIAMSFINIQLFPELYKNIHSDD